MADLGVVIKSSGATIADYGLKVCDVLGEYQLGMHFTEQAYKTFPRFFREVMNRLHPSEILFYSVDGEYGCMSNFYPASFVANGLEWKSSEHYYQAHKFMPLDNAKPTDEQYALFELVRSQPTAKACYKTAYQHADKFRPDWPMVKNQIMWAALVHKFDQHPELKQKLVATGEKNLVEHALKDAHFGCGIHHDGRNVLGKMLMTIRGDPLTLSRSIPYSEIEGWMA